MLVDYPYEWGQYMANGKIRTFVKNTPPEIISKAKELNKDIIKISGKDFFHFESDEH